MNKECMSLQAIKRLIIVILISILLIVIKFSTLKVVNGKSFNNQDDGIWLDAMYAKKMVIG